MRKGFVYNSVTTVSRKRKQAVSDVPSPLTLSAESRATVTSWYFYRSSSHVLGFNMSQCRSASDNLPAGPRTLEPLKHRDNSSFVDRTSNEDVASSRRL